LSGDVGEPPPFGRPQILLMVFIGLAIVAAWYILTGGSQNRAGSRLRAAATSARRVVAGTGTLDGSDVQRRT
jgi:hypothetical protein